MCACVCSLSRWRRRRWPWPRTWRTWSMVTADSSQTNRIPSSWVCRKVRDLSHSLRGLCVKTVFVTSKHREWKLIWQSNLTCRDSSWRCVFLSSRGRKSAAVHPQVRTAFQFSVSFFPQWSRSDRHITNGRKQVNSIYFKSLSHLIFHFPWKHNICCLRQFSSHLPSAVMQI